MGVLDGVRVVELASWVFVPAAGAVLADWGADVIKVEHPVTGDPQRGLITSGLMPGAASVNVNFMMELPNRGKRSVAIDLATDDGRELLYQLVETADVFLTSYLPDVRRRLQIDVEHIRARNPNIIYVRGSGQGQKGPDAGKGGYDAATYWARGGLANAVTPPDLEWPVSQRAAFGDLPGGMTIAGGIAGALFGRERTGTPSVVDISLLATACWQLSPDIVSAGLFDVPMGGARFSHHESPNPLVNTYKTKDGRWLSLVMLQPDRFWADLCQHLGRPELAEDPRFVDGASRFENRVECVTILDELFGAKTLAEWRETLKTLKGVWAPYQTAKEILEDADVLANGYLREVTTADGGTFRNVASPVQFDETPPDLGLAPEHGQHTEEVLLELGLSWDDIIKHKEAGAIL